MSFSVVCCTSLLTPFNPTANPNSWQCCNLLVPFAPSMSGGGASTCANIDCSSYIPVCFTTSGKNLCNYLAGIDQAICSLQAAQSNITCSQITMTGAYSCMFPPVVSDTGMSLCAWALQVNTLFCSILGALFGGSTTIPTTTITNNNVVNNNLVIDGGNGTLTTTTGVTATNGTVSTTASNTHGTAPSNVTITSTNPISSAILNTTTPIFVAADKVFKLKAFVYVGGGSPGTAVLGIIVNGTGIQKQIQTVNTASQSGWQEVVTYYRADVNQHVTISIGGSGFTSGVLAFSDLTFQPIPAINSGGYFEFQIPYIDDIGATYNNIASNFAPSLAYSAAGLNITLGMDVLVMYGKTIYTTPQTLTLSNGTTTYVYYDSWTDTYIQKTTNVTDATQLLLYTIITSGGIITSKVTDVSNAPFGAASIQNGSITGAKIAAGTIASSNLANTAVTAGSYGDAAMATHIPYFTVNAQGQITAASNVAIAFPIISVNGKTGAASLGLGDLSNVVLTAPSNGQFLVYNGANWVNSSSLVAFYQTMYANGAAQNQRAFLNFSSSFSLTDVPASNWTLVSISNNGISYAMLQQSAGGNVLLGNSTGAAGNYSEQTVNSSLLLSGGQLSVNNAANVQTGSSYNITTTDCNGQTVVGFTYPTTGIVSAVLPAANSVAPGAVVKLKDLSGNASVHNITVTVTGGANIDGSPSAVIASNYGKSAFVVCIVGGIAGWYSI